MPWDRLALVVLGVLLVGAPQAFGGVFTWAVVGIACTALAALAAALWATRAARPVAAPYVAIAVCGAAAWTVVQALPLPCSLSAMLAPESATALREAAALGGAADPTWCTLSQAAGATRLEVLKGVAIVASFLAAWLLSVHGLRKHVIWCCAFSTLVISVVAHVHMALAMEEVFGVYRPVLASGGQQLAPLMNPNNLGGFAAFGVPLWIGLLRHERTPHGRIVAGLAIGLTSSTAIMSLSRGAIAMLFGCVTLMAVLWWRREKGAARSGGSGGGRDARGSGVLRLTLTGAISGAAAFSAYLGADRVLPELGNMDTGKLDLVGKTLSFATAHPWIGIGRGAFASAYANTGTHARFAYTENFFTQWASEWGFPAALALLLAIGHALWLALREAQSLRRLGAIVGLVGLAAQNLVDLGLELAGVVVVPAALLAAVVAPSRAPRIETRAAAVPMQRVAIGSALVGALLLAWLGPRAQGDSEDELEADLRARLEQKQPDAFRGTLARAVELYPRSPVFAVLGAVDCLARRDPKAPAWINRAMMLAPGWTAPHVLGFQWLWQIGAYDQAMIELRAAAEIDANAVREHVCLVAPGGAARLLRAVPTRHREQRAQFLELAASCLAVDHPVSIELDALLVRDFADSAAARERGAQRLAARGELDAALAQLDAIQRRDPTQMRARVLRAELLFAGRRFADAAREALALVHALPPAEAARVWKLRARSLAELDDDAGWLAAIAGLRRAEGGSPDQLAESYALTGDLHRQRRQTGSALRAYREAYRIREDPRYLAAFAELSIGFGDEATALWAYMRLCETHPGGPGYCAQRDRLREKAQAAKFGPGVHE